MYRSLQLQFAGATAVDAAHPLDLLCVAPHPDDAELGMGGTLALHSARGLRVGVLDLSRGEMATNGTPEKRLRESAAASEVLGLCWRGNLGLPDRGLEGPEQTAALVGALRVCRPGVLCIPCPEDPHPDHRAAYRLCIEAVFSAGLRRFRPEAGEAGRPRTTLQYFINGWARPTFVVDVSDWRGVKRDALAAHGSQFAPVDGAAATRLTTGAAIAQVEARDRFFGGEAGVESAEGFVAERPTRLADLGALGAFGAGGAQVARRTGGRGDGGGG